MDYRFGRREFKYVLSAEAYQPIRVDIQRRLPGDVHAVNVAYPIVTEYFDTPARECFWERVDRLLNRRKLRMRCYGSRTADIPPCGFVEIKHKQGGKGVKRRVSIDVDELGQADFCIQSWFDRQLQARPATREAQLKLQEMRDLLTQRGFVSAVQMRYDREAFEAENGHLRVTFDTDIQYRRERLPLQPDCRNFEHGILPPGSAVMEVKLTQAAPFWLRELAGKFGLQRQRFSKYCRAIQSLDQIDLPGEPSLVPLASASPPPFH